MNNFEKVAMAGRAAWEAAEDGSRVNAFVEACGEVSGWDLTDELLGDLWDVAFPR